jgi:exosortase family protein XrtF
VFAAKVLAFYGLWYVLYDLWLLPDGRLDQWLSTNVAWTSGLLLQGVGVEALVQERSLSLPDTAGVRIIDGCNGLSTIGLFVGFVLAYPGRGRDRLWFIPLGVGAIYLTNVLRVIAMLLVQRYWPAAFVPLHGFGFTTIFYVVVFLLWVAWANWGGGLTAHDDPDSPSTDSRARPAVSSG